MGSFKKLSFALAASTAAVLGAQNASAGVFILDGTDADEHGSASGGANQDGWLYIQRGLENIANSSDLTRTQNVIAVMGSQGTAAAAVSSAVSLSTSLQTAGYTIVFLQESEISNFFQNTGPGLHSTQASIIYIDSGGNVNGGISNTEEAILTTNATAIDGFLGDGGGLFSHASDYGWLSALVPGLTVVPFQTTGITLTAAGTANFPGLTSADLSTGPWHNHFTNFGSIPVLGVGPNGQAVILGGSGGTITAPPQGVVPEPETWAFMIVGFGMVGGAMRSVRRRKQKIGYASI